MIVIHGESNSGKSTKALSLKVAELTNKNIQVTAFPNRITHLADLESEILNHGGLLNNRLSYVVIDPINILNDDKKDIFENL